VPLEHFSDCFWKNSMVQTEAPRQYPERSHSGGPPAAAPLDFPPPLRYTHLMSARRLILLSPYRLPTHDTLALPDAEAAAFLNGYAAPWHPAALHLCLPPPRPEPSPEEAPPEAENEDLFDTDYSAPPEDEPEERPDEEPSYGKDPDPY